MLGSSMCNPDDMKDFEQIARELIRALRGKRSQAHLSRRLGYRSNVVFDWEAGRRFPTAATLFRVARRTGVSLPTALERFLRPAPAWLQSANPATPEGVRQLLVELRGKATVLELARS